MFIRHAHVLIITYFIFTHVSYALANEAAQTAEIASIDSSDLVKPAPAVQVSILRSDEVPHTYDGKTAMASLIEVRLEPNAASPPHYHPGPVTGYVLEGTLEFQIGDQPLRVLRAGDTFFEPAMILHRVSRNPDPSKRCRILVTMLHAKDAKRLTIPATEIRGTSPLTPAKKPTHE